MAKDCLVYQTESTSFTTRTQLRTSVSLLATVVSEARSELLSGKKTHSSDRTMDLGLAEDHFSRPVVSIHFLYYSCQMRVKFTGVPLPLL